MAFTIPFKEIVELTEIFFDSDWFTTLLNTFQKLMNLLYKNKNKKSEYEVLYLNTYFTL
jgi:hypothetical protein